MSSIAVVGAGAMGGLWAALIGRAGHAVTIVDPSAELIEAVQARGLTVVEPDGSTFTTRPRAVTDPADGEPADIVFVFVKGPFTRAAAEGLGSLRHADSVVATLQNGWGNADVLAERVPADRIVVGTTYHAATIESPGRIRHGGTGPTTLGPYVDGDGLEQAGLVAQVMVAGGFECHLSLEVKTAVWMKLIHNAACLPVAALTGLRTAPLVEPGPWRDLVDELTREAVSVARALGHAIDADERIEHIHGVLGSAGMGVPSMLADALARRPTEIDTINGAVVRAARKVDLPVPRHESMVALVTGLERSWQGKPD